MKRQLQKIQTTNKNKNGAVQTVPFVIMNGDNMERFRVKVTVDRPLGSKHPEYDMIYPVNYGYAEGVTGGDGEEQDVYILGINEPVTEFDGIVTAVIHRFNDNEDKWVAVPEGTELTAEEIKAALHFQEQYFESEIIMLQDKK